MTNGDSLQHQEACKLFETYILEQLQYPKDNLIYEPHKTSSSTNPDYCLKFSNGKQILIEIYAPDKDFLVDIIKKPDSSDSEYASEIFCYNEITKAFFNKGIIKKVSSQLKPHHSDYEKTGILIYIQNSYISNELDAPVLRTIMSGGDSITYQEDVGVVDYERGIVNAKDCPIDYLDFFGIISKNSNETATLIIIDNKGNDFSFSNFNMLT